MSTKEIEAGLRRWAEAYRKQAAKHREHAASLDRLVAERLIMADQIKAEYEADKKRLPGPPKKSMRAPKKNKQKTPVVEVKEGKPKPIVDSGPSNYIRDADPRHPDYDPFTKTGNYGVWDDFMKTYV